MHQRPVIVSLPKDEWCNSVAVLLEELGVQADSLAEIANVALLAAEPLHVCVELFQLSHLELFQFG